LVTAAFCYLAAGRLIAAKSELFGHRVNKSAYHDQDYRYLTGNPVARSIIMPQALNTATSKDNMKVQILCSVFLGLLSTNPIHAEQLGEVSTKFRVLGPNDKVIIEAFDDPAVPGVTCYLSRAKTGGMGGAIGIAEDTSDASIACRQTGPVNLPGDILNRSRDGEEVFKQRTSILFKTMQVVRFYDAKRNTLVYMTYSDKLVEGSPKNSITAVPLYSPVTPQLPKQK
jgi:CreA protein